MPRGKKKYYNPMNRRSGDRVIGDLPIYKFTGDELDGLDPRIWRRSSDLLLSSGFGNPTPWTKKIDEALHDAILDALFNGGVLPEETIERLLGDPPTRIRGMRGEVEELIQQIIERMAQEG
jgi:hypothetical protein